MEGQVAEIETSEGRSSRVSRFFLFDRRWMEWCNRALLSLGLLLPGIGEYLRLSYRVEGHFTYYPGSLVIFLIGLIFYSFRLKWLCLGWMLFFCCALHGLSLTDIIKQASHG